MVVLLRGRACFGGQGRDHGRFIVHVEKLHRLCFVFQNVDGHFLWGADHAVNFVAEEHGGQLVATR